MIQRIKKPRRAALRNGFHSALSDPEDARRAEGWAGLGAGARCRQWCSCRARWKACQLRGSVCGGPQRSSEAPSALGCWLRTLQSCRLHPLGRRGEQNFLCGRKNRQPSPPSPTFQGLGQGPKASQTLEGSLGQGKIGPGGRGFKLKSVTGFLAKAISTRDLDSSPYPNPLRSPRSFSYSGLRWGN